LEFSAPKNTKLAPLTVSGFAYIAVFGPVLRPVKRLYRAVQYRDNRHIAIFDPVTSTVRGP
jgi:hypothetical protein